MGYRGGMGTEPHAVLPTGPWLVSRSGWGPHLKFFLGLSTLGVWLELQLGPLSVHVYMPHFQRGPLQWRREGERGEKTILSFLVT